MMTKRYFTSLILASAIGALSMSVLRPGVATASGQTPVGAWFGIARPCTPGDGSPAHPIVDQDFCEIACGGACPAMSPLFPVPEVTMIPTLLADGTVLADDFAAVGVSPGTVASPFGVEVPIGGDGHTTAHGKWAFLGKQQVDGDKLDRYQATFIWYQGRTVFDFFGSGGPTYSTDFFNNPVAYFKGSVRPRFTTFFDKKNPDVMKGFIQPYMYSYTNPQGIVNLQANLVAPNPDPVAPLPPTCNSGNVAENPHCFGTLQFTIRRIQAF